jgi:acyl dehydratase
VRGAMLFFEDLTPGRVFELGSREVAADEIVAFAREFDPQPFHVDAEAAKTSPFGGLIASGWHSASLLMRMYVDEVLSQAASMGSPGVEELRWLVPVRPGDVVRGRVTIVEASPSSARPDRGTVVGEFELFNQRDELAMRFRARGFFGRRVG